LAGATRTDGHEMREPRPAQQPQQNQIERPDRNVRPITKINGNRIHFAELARMAWPTKTEANLAFITGYEPRTCRRWLADDTEPPAEALAAVLAEIMRRAHQRG
jgi:hypothetical protein